ncbi:MAG TPA: GNAT family N-acetyltransferase [Candidatus Enterenecus stercoripullorum]|nr:GNAT family N-acetyltransferase [Candidatus Enterenecus stercoripullorum]
MEIIEIKEHKKRFLPLLLLGDEQESMIDRYLADGELYALQDGGKTLAVCVVTHPEPGTAEIKNLAVDPQHQRRGLGRRMVDFVAETYSPICSTLLTGTGDSPLTVPFYESCGFREAYRVPNFFLEHYDHPIVEGGRQLTDMVYFQMELSLEGEGKMTKKETLYALRNDPQVHYNCAQSMLIPFAGEIGITQEQANAIALDFGAGMGCGGTCGALTGTLMAMGGLGLPQEKREELIAEFQARHGYMDCDALLNGLQRHTPEQKVRCDGILAGCMDWLCRQTGLE